MRAEVEKVPTGQRPPGRFVRWVKNLGPGLITGAADDDPSGISTYSITGATTGFSMLWVAIITTPMMSVVQGMCARIGMVTGVGLAATLRRSFPLWIVYSLATMVIAANTFNIGADIAGMAAAGNLLFKLPVVVWVVLLGFALLFAQMFFSYKKLVNILKYLCLALLAYIVTAFVVHPNWLLVIRSSLIPHIDLNSRWITTFMGVLGTTITPYLFFWQSSLMVEEEKSIGRSTIAARKGATASEIADAHLDVNTGMALSNVVMFFIIVTTASTLGAHGKHDIASAQQAADALRPLAGKFAYFLFAAGMIGTGLLAIPALAGSSAYVAAETFAFRHGLDEHPNRVPRFYAVLGLGILLGMIMNLFKLDPIKTLFWSAVINGVAAVPLLVATHVLTNKKSIMGRWTNSIVANCWSLATIALMSGAALSMFVYWGH
ncbi:MAG: divalent metal cation transporter [Candidatus Eremiobacteraeota bacterium]|nr:divalent metal cation transporter [Candidatus Eremiobacteraeota bacterium]